MAASTNPEHFFQTSSSIAEVERKQRKSANTEGNPIKLPSKILAVEVNTDYDPTGDVAFVAEAGGLLSGIKISTREVSRLGQPSQAPLTSLAHCKIPPTANSPAQLAIFAGGWDKTITRYNLDPASEIPGQASAPKFVSQTSFKAHNDFVKCLAIAQTADAHPILISGGADGDINVWNPLTNQRLGTIKPQARAIESIALDPFSSPSAPTVFFSTSQREIFSIQIPQLSQLSSQTLQSTLSSPLIVHETSVYKLHFDQTTADLWTASADKTAKRLTRESSWTIDLTLPHPDFVKDITTHPRLPYAITACRDEAIRVWDANTATLHHVFAGHFEEVTALAITPSSNTLISTSIDATLRQWSLDPADLKRAVEKARNPNPLLQDHPEPTVDDLGLTAEEEAELQAMMDEEESESLEKMVMDTQ